MSTEPSSLENALRDEMGDRAMHGPLGGIEPAQLDAFRDAKGQLPANVFQLVRQSEGERQHTGPGRRKGSRNKRSTDLAKLIVHQFGDPVMAMASLYKMPFFDLCEMIRRADPGKDTKRGDIAIKALNIQLAAAKAVAEYVHSKKPVEHKIDTNADAIIVMPGVMGAGGFQQLDDDTRRASDIIAMALTKGQIEAADLAGMRLVDNQLVDAEFTDADDGQGE
jgi:hypothetical protein